MSTINFSWQTIHDGIEALALMVKPLRPHLIVGVARGGLVPATLLSHRLNVRLETIKAQAYEGSRRTIERPIRISGWKPDFNKAGVLIVDDIMDTGDTYEAINNNIQYAGIRDPILMTFVSLVKKKECRFPTHMFFAQVPQDVWVNFPWEAHDYADQKTIAA